jgi:ribose 5-phosphate isomerase B
MKIVFGNDHRGAEYKKGLMAKVLEWGGLVEMTYNVGSDTADSVDYPTFSKAAADKINEGYNFGVLVCGSGIGIGIAANRYKGVRAATCRSVEDAVMAREHNNANVVCIGADVTDFNVACSIVRAFIETPFDGGDRHVRRVNMIDDLTKK